MRKISTYMIAALLALSLANNANAQSMGSRLSGKILLQVERNGEAWYVNPGDQKKYYLGRPSDAFDIMRKLSLGVSNRDFMAFKSGAPARLSGRIILKVEDSGQAYYIDTIKRQLHYLGRPSDAFAVMRKHSLGIRDSDLNQIETGKTLAIRVPIEKPITLPSQSASNALAQLEIAAFNAINDYRLSMGLAKFIWNEDIAKVARNHSNDMASGAAQFGHDGLDTRVAQLRDTIELRSAAENVAYNYGYSEPASNAVSGWLESPGHYKNIVSSYTHSGMGVAKSSNGSYYFTQIFTK